MELLKNKNPVAVTQPSVPWTKPNRVWRWDKMLGTPSPYRSVFGCAPPPTKLSRFGSLNPPTSVLWVCTPSILLFSDHSALRHTKSLRTPCSRTLPLSPDPLLSCTSPSWSIWPLTSLSLFYVWVSNPGRHSSVGNTLTIQAFLLGSCGGMIQSCLYSRRGWL